MKLSFDDIRKITTGYVRTIETEKGLEFLRFTESQEETFKVYHKGFAGDPFFVGYFASTCHTSSGIKFDFYTDAKTVSVYVSGNMAPYHQNIITFDVLINGKVQDRIREKRDFTFKACGPRQKKVRVTVFFPSFDSPLISGVEIDGTFAEPAGTAPVILTMGDSITQGASANGYGCWTNVMAQKLGKTLLNQSSTGYVYDARTIERVCDPKVVICSYGINDSGRKSREELFTETDEFIAKVKEAYPDAKIAAVVPVWTRWEKEKSGVASVNESRRILREAYQKNGIYIIEGLKMVPHNVKYFADDVHPADEGHRLYGLRMAEEISKLL